jgi:tetratricopeptide (TPR) repeat protein
MKRITFVLTLACIATIATFAQAQGGAQQPPSTKQAPSAQSQQTAPQQQAGQASQPNSGAQQQPGTSAQPGQAPSAQTGQAQTAQPAGPHPPQAKTQEEFDAYKAGMTQTAPADVEKSADEFAVKYPESELRVLIYQRAMQLYWQQNDASKVLLVGRKVLAIEPHNPVALGMTATVLAERTQETDIDRNERLAEAQKDAATLVTTVDQSLPAIVPANTPPEQVQAVKGQLLAMAYTAEAKADLELKEDAKAEAALRKALQLDPSDPRSHFRLALALDHQGRYPDALAEANKAIEVGQNDPILPQATREKERLQQLTAGPPKPPAPATPPKQ